MQMTTHEIERVVREVLAKLEHSPSSGNSPPVAVTPFPVLRPSFTGPLPSPLVKKSALDSDGVLVLNQRVVTMTDVAERLAGKRRVVVRPGTVVTPSVRDELRQRNVRLEFLAAAAGDCGTSLRLIVVASPMRTDQKTLTTALRSKGVEATDYGSDCLIDATDHLAGELAKPDALGVLLTPHTAAALCLANRRSGVRAILGEEAKGLSEDAKSVGANTLIVNPEKHNSYQLQQMIETFCRGGVRRCPEVFMKQLS